MKRLVLFFVFCAAVLRADQRVVLLEYSTNTSCIPCVAATHQLDQNLQTAGRSKFAVVRYHTPSPTSVDPFYQSNKSEVETRASKYGISSNPKLFLDGVDAGQNSGSWMNGMNSELARSAPLKLVLTGTISGRTGNVHVNFSQLPGAGVRVFAVLTETGIDYEGTNGETVHDDVFQRSLTGWNGASVDTGNIVIPFTLGRDSSASPSYVHSWNPDSCRIVVWLQNTTTLAVTQAAQIWTSELTPSGVAEATTPTASALQLYPNPSNNSVGVMLQNRTAGLHLTVMDILGRVLFSAEGSSIPSQLDLSRFAAGAYRVVLLQNGIVRSSLPLIRN